MKRIFTVLLATCLLLNIACFAAASEPTFSIEEVATYFMNDALEQPNSFHIPDLNGKNIYLCNAMHPYVLNGNELQVNNNVVYYLVKTNDEIIASITLCYANGTLMSASFDPYVADIINDNCEVDEAFQLIGQDGILYVKTADDVCTSNAQTFTRTSSVDTVVRAIENAEGDLRELSVKSQLTDIITNPVASRSSKILNVPYVAQVSNTCWAAAAAAFGRYYTGNTYAHYTAQDLAALMGIPLDDGAGMSATRTVLSRYYNLSTTYYSGRLSNSVAINLFQQNKPIIAGFQGDRWHMVVLCGYDDHATGVNITFYVRDSNYSYLRSVISYSNTGPLVMDYYGDEKTWEEGLY